MYRPNANIVLNQIAPNCFESVIALFGLELFIYQKSGTKLVTFSCFKGNMEIHFFPAFYKRE